jgi:hypothetical protein
MCAEIRSEVVSGRRWQATGGVNVERQGKSSFSEADLRGGEPEAGAEQGCTWGAFRQQRGAMLEVGLERPCLSSPY